MKKPEWKTIWRWANWLCRNAQGKWMCFENKPTKNEEAGGWWTASGEWDFIEEPRIGIAMPETPWQESLEARPPETDDRPLMMLPPLFEGKKK